MEGPPVPTSYRTGPHQERSLLWRLADHTDLLERGPNGVMIVREFIDTPYDEYGIIDRKELFRRLLGSVASHYHWEGSFAGPHHLMWPKAAYSPPNVPNAVASIATCFRGSPSLKVILPRQLHDYLHRITQPPTVPAVDVMRQYALEQQQVSRLYATVNTRSYREQTNLSPQQKEELRRDGLLRKLETMEDGQLGLMPDRNLLAALPLAEARQLLRHRARSLGISAHRAAQRVFFADEPLALADMAAKNVEY